MGFSRSQFLAQKAFLQPRLEPKAKEEHGPTANAMGRASSAAIGTAATMTPA